MKHPMMLDMQLISGLNPYGSTGPRREYILHNGMTGKDWAKRKSRSKLAKKSRKRNR